MNLSATEDYIGITWLKKKTKLHTGFFCELLLDINKVSITLHQSTTIENDEYSQQPQAQFRHTKMHFKQINLKWNFFLNFNRTKKWFDNRLYSFVW